jgi:hypothetical protein
MPKKSVCGLLLLAILGCTAAIATRNAYAYILCFMMLVAAISLGMLMLTADLMWKFLSDDFKKTWEGKPGRFNAIILASALSFYIAAGAINGICLLNAPGFISLLGNMAALAFAVFLGWTLTTRTRLKTIAIASVVFILFIASLSLVSSATLKSGKIAEVNPAEKLKSLGYVNWFPVEENKDKTGVTLYDRELAYDGLNFYNSQISPEAYLIDMNGNILHKWARKVENCDAWNLHAELCENGDLLVASVPWLIRLDWDSNVKWKKRSMPTMTSLLTKTGIYTHLHMSAN